MINEVLLEEYLYSVVPSEMPCGYPAEALKAQAAAIAKELNDKQNKVVCPGCGKQCSNTAAFCSACGAKLIIEAEASEEPAPQPEEQPETHQDQE